MRRILSTPDASFRARAVLVGERIDLKALGAVDALGANPLTVEVKGGGAASLFRFGVVVFFAVTPIEQMAFLRQLQPLIANAYATPEIEELDVQLEPGTKELVKGGVVGTNS